MSSARTASPGRKTRRKMNISAVYSDNTSGGIERSTLRRRSHARSHPSSVAVMGPLGASLLGAAPASAYCGAQCREAKSYCKSWEKDHPGEECGTVRGYSCTGSSWKRIKIVNSSWSACRLVKGADDLHAAEARCAKYEKVEGGLCQVHSPLCNAGWRSIGDYGKFRACRPLEAPSGSLAYDGYKAFFSGVEGEADTAIPEHLHPFLKKHYSIDLASVRFGHVTKIKGADLPDRLHQDLLQQVRADRRGAQGLPLAAHPIPRAAARPAMQRRWWPQGIRQDVVQAICRKFLQVTVHQGPCLVQ